MTAATVSVALLSGLMSAAMALAAPPSPSAPPTAAELAGRNVAAHGGTEALRGVHSARLTGTLRFDGGARETAIVTLVRPPAAIRFEAELQGLTQVQAFDGQEAWQVDPFEGRKDPEKLSADAGKAMGEDAADFLGVLFDYEAKGYRLEYLGTEDVEGTEAHKLRVTRPNGDIVTVYLDPDYFLEIRTVERRIEHGAPHETLTDYGDYEKVDGITLAFAQESGRPGGHARQKVQYSKAELNVPLDDAAFRFPAARAGAKDGT